MMFAGKQLTEADIARAYKAVFSQFDGQVVECDILSRCHYWEEVNPADMAEQHHMHNFANWFLKRLGIIREDNLVNMIRHFMGPVPVIVGENPKEGENNDV